MEKGHSSSRVGLVIGALVVGAIAGFFIGHQASRSSRPALDLPTTPLPAPPPPISSGSISVTTGAITVAPSCLGPGIKYISVEQSGPGCVDAEMFAAAGDRIIWQSPQGSSLWIIFKEPKVFPHRSCAANTCEAGLPELSAAPTNQKTFDYDAVIFGKGTPTPLPNIPTPTPRPAYGRIIIKP
jgi:hypothetical protein